MNYNDTELFNDLKNNFEACEHSDVNGISFTVEAGGSKGGNCYGDSSTEFHITATEMIDSIQEQIISASENYFYMLQVNLPEDSLRQQSYNLAETIVDTPYNTIYDSDCYGNHSEYNKYFVSIVDILNFLDGTILEQDKEKILSIVQEAQNEVFSENMKKSQYSLLKETEKNIDNFKRNSDNEEKQLQSSLERAKKEVVNISKKLDNLEKQQLDNLKQLEKTKKDIITFLGEDYIQSKEVKVKKYGY